MVRISDLENRDVININDGRRMGNVVDLELDLESGRIKAIVVPGTQRLLGLWGKHEEMVIEWDKIKKIGADVILVEVTS